MALKNIKLVGKQMPICYYFVDMNIVHKFNMI